MVQERKVKMKKGWVAVEVGLEEDGGSFQRFSVPISYLYNPLFQHLLDKAHEIYGYRAIGLLRLPSTIFCISGGGLRKKWPATMATATYFRLLLLFLFALVK